MRSMPNVAETESPQSARLYLAALTRRSDHTQEPRRRRRHGSCFPRLVAVAPRPPRKARQRALLQTPRPAGRRAWQGRRWAAPVDARHAGRVPALPPPAWARSSVAPPERRGEAGCLSPVATVEAADAARFVPPVFSSSFSGARAKSYPASGAAACPHLS